MIRALAEVELDAEGEPVENPTVGAVLYCNIGDVTNLAVARGRGCLFARVSPVGLEAVTSRLGTARGLSQEHASQWLNHVGLQLPVEQIEGDAEVVAEARRSLEEGVSAVTDEIRLSLDYYGSQEGTLPVERVVVCGPGSAIDGLPARMEANLSLPVSVVQPAPLAGFDAETAARLTLPLGLALEV
jgi:Tfp pilus assembly PilM family ATPase